MSNCWAMMVTSLLFVGSMPGLAQAGVQLGLVAEAPAPTFLPFRSSGLVMFLSLKDTWSVGERWKTWPITIAVGAGLARGEHARHPADAELGLAARDDGRRHDLDRARQDRDVEALFP